MPIPHALTSVNPYPAFLISLTKFCFWHINQVISPQIILYYNNQPICPNQLQLP